MDSNDNIHPRAGAGRSTILPAGLRAAKPPQRLDDTDRDAVAAVARFELGLDRSEADRVSATIVDLLNGRQPLDPVDFIPRQRTSQLDGRQGGSR